MTVDGESGLSAEYRLNLLAYKGALAWFVGEARLVSLLGRKVQPRTGFLSCEDDRRSVVMTAGFSGSFSDLL